MAFYIRLSKEDEDLGMGKQESNSITNQRMLLYDYLHTHPEFQGCKVIEKCDDGYSGKKFDRPQFLELIELAKQRKVNCIIVKDFSRFGRDYVEIGDYLEQLFPFLGIRFISVNDRYDSAENGKAGVGLEVAFQNFIYDFYSRDTSQKIRTIRRKMAQEGAFASANAPYGYIKSPDDRHKLAIDEEAAEVVREIYRLKLSGLSAQKITELLNARAVPSPAQYALNKKRGMDWRRVNEKTAWDATKVVAILKDERYTGTMVSLRRTLKGVYGRDTAVDREDWIRVENTHEAIIDKADFQRVQDTFLVYDKSQPSQIERYNPFFCAHCGRRLSYNRDRKKLLCRFGKTNPAAACYGAAYEAETLKTAVLSALKWQFEQFAEWEQLMKAQAETQEDARFLQKSLETLEKSKLRLYEAYREEGLSREDYLAQRKDINVQITALERRLAELQQLGEEADRQEQLSRWVQQFQNEPTLTKEMERLFVEQVTVYDAEHIRVRWRFEDVFRQAEQRRESGCGSAEDEKILLSSAG